MTKVVRIRRVANDEQQNVSSLVRPCDVESEFRKDRESAIYENPLNDFCSFIAAIEEPLPCDIKLKGFSTNFCGFFILLGS
jgi:hypothetical protein